MNTSTAVKITYKTSAGPKKVIAFLIDLAVLYFAMSFTFQFFPIDKILPDLSPILRYVSVGFYYYFFLTIVAQTIFSQTLGMFILGMKVVTKNKFKKLSFVQALCHSLYLYFLSESVVVDIR